MRSNQKLLITLFRYISAATVLVIVALGLSLLKTRNASLRGQADFTATTSGVTLAILPLTPNHLLTVFVPQTTSATVSGTITDQNNSVVPGVTVTIENTGTRLERRATTDNEGQFIIPQLPPATYILTAQKEGFAPVRVPDLVLNVNDNRSLKIQLAVGQVNGNVNIQPDTMSIETTPEVGTVVDRGFVENMPLSGRSFQQLITLAPGVLLTRSGNDQGQFSINGQRANANYFTVDGVSANTGVSIDANTGTLGQTAGGTLPGLSASGTTGNLVSVDALQEFKVLTSSYAPEFGRAAGGQIQIVTRSGTNSFHGTLSEYFRNDALDSNDWFANSRALPKPALRQNDFGGVFGGPLLLPRFGEGGSQPGYDGRNKTFFFFSYEGLRLRQPNVAISDVPTLATRNAAAPAIKPLLQAFPLPNGPDRGNGLAEFAASFSNPTTLNATSIRIDHTFSSRVNLFGRYNYAPSNTIQRGVSNVGLSTLSTSEVNTQTLTMGLTFSATPHLSNDLRFNYTRNGGSSILSLDNFGGAIAPPSSALFPTGITPTNGETVLIITSGAKTLVAAGTSGNNIQRQINIVDGLTLIARDHQLKFGIDYRRLNPYFAPPLYTATGLFFSTADAISGISPLAFLDVGGSPRTILFSNYSVYGQDVWTISRRFTLTYGFRWEFNPPPTSQSSPAPFPLVNTDNPAAITLGQQGSPLYKRQLNNFAPRVGLAYKLSEKPGRETVLRGGMGVFYDIGNGETARSFGVGFPFTSDTTFFSVPFPFPDSLAVLPPVSFTPPLTTIYSTDPNLKLPYTIQWNVTAERALGTHQTFSAAYVGAIGRRQLRSETLNNPNPTFSKILLLRNGSTSDYHAMQLQFNRRLSSGLQALASYTWSHSIDTFSNDLDFANVPSTRGDLNLDRGNSDFDVRHSASAAVTYDLPYLGSKKLIKSLVHGWATDAIFTARSATPVNLIGASISNGFSATIRPDLIQNVPLYINDPTAPGGRRINRAAFKTPPVGPGNQFIRQGTLGRNVLRGFPLWQLDFAIRRTFPITERLRLQLKAEIFNVLNHPNFGNPGSNGDNANNITNAQFGLSTMMFNHSLGNGGAGGGLNPLYQIGGPRSMQLSFKLDF